MSEVTKVTHGLYFLQPEDNASTVARRLYGDVHKSNVILQANPGDWDELERVVVPNKTGRTTTALAGETPHKVIARVFPNQPVHLFMKSYFIWNGGEKVPLEEGMIVFLPDR